jgi:hypothetical protein
LFTVIDLALGEEEEGDQADERMISAATSLLAGNLRSFSFSRAFLRVFTKALRMLVFLILPSIAWEDRTAVQAARRGLGVLQAHLPEFSTGLITSELIAFSIFLPVILFFSLVESLELSLPGNGIPIGIIFLTLAWSLIFYVEQVFAALLYTWHLSWEAAHESQSKNYGGPPSLHDIPMPSLLDGVPEFD